MARGPPPWAQTTRTSGHSSSTPAREDGVYDPGDLNDRLLSAAAPVPPPHGPSPELPAGQRYRTPECVVAQIDNLLDSHTDAEVAALLNESGLRTGHGVVFRPQRVQAIRKEYRLSSRYQRLRARGLLTVCEAAATPGVSTHTVKQWRHHGLLRAHRYNDRDQWLYEPPSLTRGPQVFDKS